MGISGLMNTVQPLKKDAIGLALHASKEAKDFAPLPFQVGSCDVIWKTSLVSES